MADVTYQQIADSIGANLSQSLSATDKTRLKRAVGALGTITIGQAADALANSTSTDWVYAVDNKMEFTAVKLVPTGALTSDNTTYATISLEYDDGNGGSDTQIAAFTTKTTLGGGTGDWTAGTALTLTLSATQANRIVDGTTTRAYLILKHAKASTGVAVPKYRMFADYALR